jgi:hypothetical protein
MQFGELGKALSTISLWFKSSGLKINEEKTEISIFYNNNCNLAEVQIIGSNGSNGRTKNTIKVLGIMMDTMLAGQEHISIVVNNVQSKNTCNQKNTMLLFE